MKKQLIISLKLLGIMIVLLGGIYPLLITGITQTCFPYKANGSLIEKNGKVIGSSLIGQSFTSEKYFSSRISATAYSSLPSGASNLGLTSQKLHNQVIERKARFIAYNGLTDYDTIPSEMIFASGSGLDPHISPQAASLQVNRIAKARNFSEQQKQTLQDLIKNMTENSQFSLMGESRINVLLLNLQLDKLQ